jgi:hypothetical protein
MLFAVVGKEDNVFCCRWKRRHCFFAALEKKPMFFAVVEKKTSSVLKRKLFVLQAFECTAP